MVTAGAVEHVSDMRGRQRPLGDPAIECQLELAIGGVWRDVHKDAGRSDYWEATLDPNISAFENAAAVDPHARHP